MSRHTVNALFTASHISAALAGGALNLLWGLDIIGPAAAAAVSFASAAVYISGIALLWRPAPKLRPGAAGAVFWGVSLAGFVFYAMFFLFDIPVAVAPIPYMTAFLRFMLMLLTLPVMAVNYITVLIPSKAAAFIFALFFPVCGFISGIAALISAKRARSREKGPARDE